MLHSRLIQFTASLAVVVVCALLAQFAHAQAGQRGIVTGTVMTHEGKPAVGLVVKLVKDTPRDMRRPGSTGIGDSRPDGLQGGSRTKTIAQATCDAQGKFTMQNVPVGDYRLEAGNKNVGWIFMDVSVEAGKTVELNDLKLTKTG